MLKYWPGVLIQGPDGCLRQEDAKKHSRTLDDAVEQIERWRAEYPGVIMGYVDREDKCHISSVWRRCYLQPDKAPDDKKPVLHFQSKGPSGNIYAIMGEVKKIMVSMNEGDRFCDLWDQMLKGESYEAVLRMVRETIDLIDDDGVY